MRQVLYVGGDAKGTQAALANSDFKLVPYVDVQNSQQLLQDSYWAAVVEIDHVAEIQKIKAAYPSIPVLVTWAVGFEQVKGADMILRSQKTLYSLGPSLEELIEAKSLKINPH